jgi:hypothetical protein
MYFVMVAGFMTSLGAQGNENRHQRKKARNADHASHVRRRKASREAAKATVVPLFFATDFFATDEHGFSRIIAGAVGGAF